MLIVASVPPVAAAQLRVPRLTSMVTPMITLSVLLAYAAG